MKTKITFLTALVTLLSFGSLNAQTTARVQVIHNSADLAAATVDVYLNDGLLSELDDLEFRTATPFIDAPAGVPIRIDVAPGTSLSSAETIYDITVTLVAGETYILVADGIVSASGYDTSVNTNTAFAIQVYGLGRETSSMMGNTDVLIHHGSTDAPTVDVNNASSLPTSVLVDNAAYTNFSPYLELPTANYTINVSTADGSTVVQTYSAPLASLNLTNQAITVVASGFLNPADNSNGPVFGLWVATASGGALVELPVAPMARVQVIHNSADLATTTVDVYVNDGATPALNDFAFRTASPFISIPAGPVSIDVLGSNSTSSNNPLYTLNTTLVGGETYILVAEGIVSSSGYDVTNPNAPFKIVANAMSRETSSMMGNTDVLVHHGASDAPTVDVNNVTSGSSSVLVNDISYTEFSTYLQLPTADYTINVSTADGATVVQTYSAPLATLGLTNQAITVVASGFLNTANNSDGPAFGLWAATAAGGALVELPAAALSSSSFELQNVTVYPNPANNMVNVSFPDYENTSAKLLDMLGRTVSEVQLLGERTSLDISNLNTGMYILKLDKLNTNGSKTIKIQVN